MNTCERSKTLFVGIDVHKDTHTAVGLSPFGEKIFEMKIGNEAADFVSLIEKAQQEANRIDLTPSFGLEDVHSWGERLSSFLVEEGLPVRAVAPILVDHIRQKATHPEKSDSLDAQGVAEVMIRRIDTLPVYTLIEKELASLIETSGHTLSTASGCGIVIAAEIIGEIGDISRFHAPASLAKYAGCAPREHSSGKTIRWRKTRSGNRRLNRAFHRMALSQIS